jgi:hypothetical protein
MKLLWRNVSSRGSACLIALLLFLVAAAFDIQAQDSRAASIAGDRESAVKEDTELTAQITERAEQSTQPHQTAEAYMRIAANQESRALLLADRSKTSGPLPSGQGTTNGGYVFPTKKQRFKRYLWDTVGPWSLIAIGGAAGIDQWENSPPEWGQGASGYGKRYASNLGQNVIQQTTSYGLSEAFRLDTGFSKSKRSGFGPRLEDALIQNLTSRTRNGKRIISVPRLAGFYVGGIVPALTWYPSRFSYKDGLREGTYSLLFGFAANVIQEFILHR